MITLEKYIVIFAPTKRIKIKKMEEIDFNNKKVLDKYMELMSHPVRIRIIENLSKKEESKKKEVFEDIAGTKQYLHYHLQKLISMGIVEKNLVDDKFCYNVNVETLKTVRAAIFKSLKEDDAQQDLSED